MISCRNPSQRLKTAGTILKYTEPVLLKDTKVVAVRMFSILRFFLCFIGLYYYFVFSPHLLFPYPVLGSSAIISPFEIGAAGRAIHLQSLRVGQFVVALDFPIQKGEALIVHFK